MWRVWSAVLCGWVWMSSPGVAGEVEALPLLETVDSPHSDAAAAVGALTTVHVVLQVHATATLKGPVQTPESARCQDRIERTLLGLHEAGRLRSVVGEGLVARGLAHAPAAISSSAKGERSAVSRLIGVKGLEVYGMERADVQAWGMAQLEAMRETATGLEALAASDLSDADKRVELRRLEAPLYRATTSFSAGDMPLRSFQAMQTALAVADAYGQNEVAIVMGRQHWPDFVHAVAAAGRLGTGRYGALRVHKYACDNGLP